MIQKILIKILKFVAVIIGLILFYLLMTFVLSRIPVKAESVTSVDMDIYILTNGVHSDIVVPIITDQKNWFTHLDILDSSTDKNSYNYLALGWGDKGFYLNTPSWAELKVSTAIKAAIGISGTAIHATFYKDMIESEKCKKISISKDQYTRLINFIQESFEINENGELIKIITDVNKGESDAFYEATGRYSVFNTCNSWTNRGLKSAGQRACLWTALQKPIFLIQNK